MNDLITPNQGELELNLDEPLTPEEDLLAKSILANKVLHGLTARLGPVQERLDAIREDDIRRHTLNIISALHNLGVYQCRLLDKYAERLGVSKQRYKEIRDLVYEKETHI